MPDKVYQVEIERRVRQLATIYVIVPGDRPSLAARRASEAVDTVLESSDGLPDGLNWQDDGEALGSECINVVNIDNLTTAEDLRAGKYPDVVFLDAVED